MKRTFSLASLAAAVLCGCAPGAGKRRELTLEEHREIADHLAAGISDLRGRCALMAELRLADDGRPQKIWLRFDCDHGIIGQEPNPEWNERAKVSRTRPVFSDDGLEFVLYVHLGQYPGAAALPWINVAGDLNVTVSARGPRGKDARAEIERVVSETRRWFGLESSSPPR